MQKCILTNFNSFYTRQSVFQEESATLLENVFFRIIYMDINKYAYTRSWTVLGKTREKIYSFCSSTYRTCITWSVMRTQRRSVLWPIAKPHHTEASVLWKVLGTVRTICEDSGTPVFISFRYKLQVKYGC